MRFFAASILLVAMLAGDGTAVAAPTFPTSDSSWTALEDGGEYLTDPSGESGISPDSIDVVGSTTYPAGFWYEEISSATDDYVMFRMRVSDDGTGDNYVWQILLNTDSDTNIDWAVQVVQSGSSTGVYLSQATTGGSTFKDVALGDPSWTGSLTTYSQWTSTGANNFGNNTDYFVDVAVPWLTLRYYTGLREGGSFQVALSTSSSHATINKDLPLNLTDKSNVSDGWGDSITLSSSHAPEPATLALFGLGLGGAFLARRKLAARKKGAADGRAPRR